MSKANRKGTGNQPGVVIKKEEVVEGEAHGGAWKVAYADFVTAMMAFFLLMWLLNATTEDQRKGLADYFSPNSLLSHASSGTGDPFGGHTAFDQGALVSDRGAVQALTGTRPVPLTPNDADDHPDTPQRADLDDEGNAGPGLPNPTPNAPPQASAVGITGASVTGNAATVSPAPPPGSGTMTTVAAQVAAPAPGHAGDSASAAQLRPPTEAELREAREQQERTAFAAAAAEIRKAVAADPALAELARQLVIDMTPEGLRIQMMDAEQRPMFALGSADPNERARLLLQKVTPVLMRLPEAISIAGHTDAAPFPGPDRTNWELSTERANATRRLLEEGGLADTRIRSVTGNADRDLLLPKDPLAAANRRIAIIVLKDSGLVPPGSAAAAGGSAVAAAGATVPPGAASAAPVAPAPPQSAVASSAAAAPEAPTGAASLLPAGAGPGPTPTSAVGLRAGGNQGRQP